MMLSNRNREQDLASFRGLLTRVMRDPQAIIYTSARPSGPVDRSLWERSPDLDGFRSIAQAIRKRVGEDEGALVVVADVEEDPSARAYIAARAARLLAEEGLRILLVETAGSDGGFLGATQTDDHEGFVDLVLYGVSPQVACRPTPVSGIHLMTPGSFPPDPGELYNYPEMEGRLAQLKAPYDVVLMLATAFSEENQPNPLLSRVDGLILACRPPASPRFTALVEAVVGDRSRVWGAVVFTSPTETVELAVEDALDEREWETLISRKIEPVVAAAKDHSSSLFRWGTITLAVVLLGFAGWWGWTQRDGGDRTVSPPATRPQASTVTDEIAAPDLAQVDATSSGSEESGATQPPDSPDAGVTASGTDEVPGEKPAAQATPPAATSQETTEPAASGEESALSPDPRPASPTSPRAANEDVAFDEGDPGASGTTADGVDPVRRDLSLVPGGGYSVHLWSFPSSGEADAAIEKLRRDGYASASVAVPIEGKGTWYRVVVGRFASSQEAKDGKDLLMQRPDVDWAAVVRVP